MGGSAPVSRPAAFSGALAPLPLGLGFVTRMPWCLLRMALSCGTSLASWSTRFSLGNLGTLVLLKLVVDERIGDADAIARPRAAALRRLGATSAEGASRLWTPPQPGGKRARV